ncbi:hypothetical protein [Fusibacter sp. JL216-2]
MIKRVLIGMSIVLVLLFANSLIQLEYDMTLIDYLSPSAGLSDEDMAYL